MMPTLHLVALGLYGLAAALALAPFAGLPSLSRRWSVALPGAGALAHGMALAQLTPAGLAPILSLLALFLIVLRLCCELLLRATAGAVFSAPLAAGLLGVGVRFAAGVDVAPAQLVWGSFTWVVLGWAVWARVVRGWAGRRAAFMSIAGFAAVVLVYLALKLVEPGRERFL